MHFFSVKLKEGRQAGRGGGGKEAGRREAGDGGCRVFQLSYSVQPLLWELDCQIIYVLKNECLKGIKGQDLTSFDRYCWF